MLRFKSIFNANNRVANSYKDDVRLSSIFEENVFNNKAMKEYLTDELYNRIKNSRINNNFSIGKDFADSIAQGIKNWAISKGATSYTHWFQPLTGVTAEKHDSFLSISEGAEVIEKFEGDMLVKQEPDASSLPSGGTRTTFEARGYTAWDPSSPPFVIGKTLCIPTVYVSYNGRSLDNKVPLLKSLKSLNKAALDIVKIFDKDVDYIYPTLGWEQEFFLIDIDLFNSRPDLALTGRSLLGHASAKGQQLNDHYFGFIPSRVMNFMKDLEIQALKLGIPIKTCHNEVAPNQFEFASIFEEVNLAVDHNVLFMNLMEQIAIKHKFKVVFNEKPFKGVNGSGKHNNWSLSTNTGDNLLNPKDNNLRFLLFFTSIIKAVNDNPNVLRVSTASIGNDNRLGLNEAPPSIISVFIGEQLFSILDKLEKDESIDKNLLTKNKTMKIFDIIPDIILDNTDRNRTSPFAFTGNKFEFRAVGSSHNCSSAVTAINTIVTDQLVSFKKDFDELISKGKSRDKAILSILKKYVKDSKKVIFEGDGYSQQWVEMAEKRGLPNLSTTPEALQNMLEPNYIELFSRNNVMTEDEVKLRYKVYMENYVLKMQIESRVLGDLARNHIVPISIKYQNTLLDNCLKIKKLFKDKYTVLAKEQIRLTENISEHIEKISYLVNSMINERKKANKIEDIKDKTFYYCYNVRPYLEKIRYSVDKLEFMVDDNIWPLTKYRELLFIK